MISLRGLNDFLLSFLHFSIPVLAFLSAGTRKSGSDASFLSSGRASFFRSVNAESFLPSTGKSIFSKNAFLHRYHPGAQPGYTGWSNYHKCICAKRTFSRLGTFIYRQLKRWAKYQHGNKNRWWIYYRYFQNNHFTDQRITKKGIEHNRLYRIAYVPIRYHVKVKSKANPFLPEFDKYFFKRTKWREDLAKECKQVTTFVMQETINHGRVSLGRDSFKRA